MEVHAHTHHGKKKWTEYIWEFLMLFLAVFCGFLAENFREHQIEKQREKQFIISLIQDLKADTANIIDNIAYNKKIIKGKDSLQVLLHQIKANKAGAQYENDFVHLLSTYAVHFRELNFVDNTITQLKNSGSLRLIRNQAATDSIGEYYRLAALCEKQGNVAESYSHESNLSVSSLIDGYNIAHPGGESVLRSKDPDKITDYSNHLGADMGASQNYLNKLINQNTLAEHLIVLLKKEYSLK